MLTSINWRGQLTRLRNILIQRDWALQLSQVRIGLPANRQRRVMQMHHLPDVIVPHVRVKGRGLIVDSQGGITLDNHSGQVGLSPGVVHGLLPVEQFQRNGFDAHRQGHGELQSRFQRKFHRIRPGFEDGRGVQEEHRAVDDILRDGGNTDEKACIQSASVSNAMAPEGYN